MYNEDIKNEFINKYTKSANTANVCKRIFNALEKYEVRWEADVCTKDAETLQPIIEENVGLRLSGQVMTLTILKDYVKWCLTTEKVSGACDGMLKVSVDGLDKIKRQMVSSPAHLAKYLDKVFDPVDEKTLDNIYRCYYWLAYAGMKEEEILKARSGAVDFSKMVIKCGDFEAPIYREAVPALKNCAELTQFTYKHPLYSEDKVILKNRAQGDELVRGTKSVSSAKTFRANLSQRSTLARNEGRTSMELSYSRVWLSGVFYRAQEDEKMGCEINFGAIASRQIGDKIYKLDKGRNKPEYKKRQIAKEYSEDYQRWKLAFEMGGIAAERLDLEGVEFPKKPMSWQEFSEMSEESQVAYMKYLTNSFEVFQGDLALMFGCYRNTVRHFLDKHELNDTFRVGKRILPEKRDKFFKWAGINANIADLASGDYLEKPMKWAEFRRLPIDSQVKYMQSIFDRFSPKVADVARMFECSYNAVRNFCDKEGIDRNSYKGKRPSKDNRKEFAEFVEREK